MDIENYNHELKLAHEFIRKQYETYLRSERIKNDPERRAYAHAVQVTGYIAHNCTIKDKQTPLRYKKQQQQEKVELRPEFYNTPLED